MNIIDLLKHDGIYLAITNLQNQLILKEAYSLGIVSEEMYREYISTALDLAIKHGKKGGPNGTDEELSDMAGGEVPKQSPGNDLG